jgi:GTP-binding protein Era
LQPKTDDKINPVIRSRGIELTEQFRSGFVALVGRPNVGKSTLMNRMLGDTLSIVTPKAQTTRHRINGIYTTPSCQMILVDTPGVHESGTPLNEAMTRAAEKSLQDSDIVLFITVGTREPHDQDLRIIELIKAAKTQSVLAINKIDTIKPATLLPLMESFSKLHDFQSIIPVSATTGEGVDELVQALASLLPLGPALFPEDEISDQPMRFFVQEMVREQLTLLTGEEIPYKSAVVVESFEEKRNIVVIRADIHCEKESQKKIIIGKKGQMIKKIGIRARANIEAFLGTKVHLELFVKVSPGWTKKNNMLREFGYLVK